MGKHRRAFEAAQRSKETFRKRIITAAAVAGLGAAAVLAHGVVTGGGDQKTATTASVEKKSPMAADLQALLQQTTSVDLPVDRLIGLRHHELESFKVGERTVRVIDFFSSRDTEDAAKEQLEVIRKNYEVYHAFAQSNAKMTMPVYEADENDAIVSERQLEVGVAPVNKDVVLFLVPSSVDIGSFKDAPTTFTNTEHEIAVSFVRPDFPQGAEGVITETRQAMVDAQILNKSELDDVDQEKAEKIRMLAQENLCNVTAKARYMVHEGYSNNDYVQAHSKQVLGSTNVATPGNTAFYSSMPYINNESVYVNLWDNIPADIGNSFTYPPVTS